MAVWWSEKNCAQWVKTYQEMPWHYKGLENSCFVLSPVFFSLAASQEPAGWICTAYWVIAGLYFLNWVIVPIQHFRGKAAILRGVEPAPLKSVSSYRMHMWGIILYLSLLVMYISAFLIHQSRSPSSEDWSWFAWCLGMLTMQLSSFARSRFMKSSESRQLTVRFHG